MNGWTERLPIGKTVLLSKTLLEKTLLFNGTIPSQIMIQDHTTLIIQCNSYVNTRTVSTLHHHHPSRYHPYITIHESTTVILTPFCILIPNCWLTNHNTSIQYPSFIIRFVIQPLYIALVHLSSTSHWRRFVLLFLLTAYFPRALHHHLLNYVLSAKSHPFLFVPSSRHGGKIDVYSCR